jgi:hypothetical protein
LAHLPLPSMITAICWGKLCESILSVMGNISPQIKAQFTK